VAIDLQRIITILEEYCQSQKSQKAVERGGRLQVKDVHHVQRIKEPKETKISPPK
jgi:hypothetical protein